ncbi:MAG: tetratricopeptide repeat protein [Chloroflexi bacterium]|nr:tetratricopeptide repeat protein [Chloroflexota bacterium]
MSNHPVSNWPVNKWLWLVLLMLVPVTYNPVSKWQYEPDRVALILALTGLLLAAAAVRGGVPRLGGYRVEWWIAGYLAVRWLATAFSVLPHYSLWGDPAWRNGMWLLLAGVVLFGLARRQFTQRTDREQAINLLLVVSGPVAGYGVLQAAGWDFLHLDEGRTLGRVASIQAHPNYLAAYLAMLLPLVVLRLLVDAGRRRWAWAGLLAVQVLCLVFTYSRAGWLAALGGVVAFGLLRLWMAGRHRAAGGLALMMVAGFVVLLVLSMLPPLPGDAPHVLQTITSMFRWEGSTARIRLLAWDASLDAIQARPLLGTGPGTYRIALEWYVKPELAPYSGAAALGGRAHNGFIEVAVESGLLGLFAYLGLLAALVLPLLRSVLTTPDENGHDDPRLFRAAILGSLAAYLVNHVFSFESAATAMLFWTFSGMAHAHPLPPQVRTFSPLRIGWAAGVVGLALAASIVVADLYAYRADRAASNAEWAQAVDSFEQAAKIGPTPEIFRSSQGWVYAAWATETKDETIWQTGQAVYADLVTDRPDVVEYHKRWGTYLRRWYLSQRQPDPALTQQALEVYNRALSLSPDDPDLWLDRGHVYLDKGELDLALHDFGQANALLPDYVRYYGAMTRYAFLQGDRAAATEWAERQQQAQQDWDNWVWRR